MHDLIRLHIKLLLPRHFLLKCMYQSMKLADCIYARGIFDKNRSNQDSKSWLRSPMPRHFSSFWFSFYLIKKNIFSVRCHREFSFNQLRLTYLPRM